MEIISPLILCEGAHIFILCAIAFVFRILLTKDEIE
jgi:hypothetical protein